MKPRNKREYEVARLSAGLHEITSEQECWAYDHCFDKTAYFSKGEAWCSECGGVFEYRGNSPLGMELLGGDKVECPHCGTMLELKNSRKQKLEERWYYTVVEKCEEYQVLRHFVAAKYIRKGEQPRLYIREAVQNWITPDGRETIMARGCNPVPHYYDSWNFSTRMEIRQRRMTDYRPDKYKIHAEYIYPHRHVSQLLRRNGYTAKCDVLAQSDLIKMLYTDREAEVLIKNRQYSILEWKHKHGYREFCLPYRHAVRIAIRNKYIVKDAGMWFDYLDLLSYFHLDTHNAHYVCPKRLKQEHDRLEKRKRRAEAKRAEEAKRKEAVYWESQYAEEKGKYFGVCFGNERIVITVIKSVSDMAEEGKAMHHCVYSNGYYKKQDVLILSARKPTGERIETIELSLVSFEVVQSRGKCNTNTEYHDEILELVRNNVAQIMAIKDAV